MQMYFMYHILILIGGINILLWTLLKKYKDKDINICIVISDNQLNRIRKYARVIYQPIMQRK